MPSNWREMDHQSSKLIRNTTSTHSVRVGGATKLLNAGADRLVIKLLGRWLSNSFEEYPVLTADGTRGLSAMMVVE